jgi:glutamate racemase
MQGGWLGIFDSGVGGLTVARAIATALPHADIAYLGDTARVPYGTRSPETVRRYAKGCARVLSELGLRALVIACNTASAVARADLAQEFDGPVLGVIKPGARQGAAATRTGHLAVLATATTTASGAYPLALEEAAPGVRVTSLSCPLLVPLAEEGWVDGAVPTAVARRYLAPLEGTDVDTLVLGCTHYPLLKGVLRQVGEEVLGHPLTIVDSAEAVAHELVARLDAPQAGEAASELGSGRRMFQVTDSLESFAEVAPRFFGGPVQDVRLVDVVPSGP